MTAEERVKKAMEIAMKSGCTDGGHHKMWVIDQMVRALTDCPIYDLKALDYTGKPFEYKGYGKSEEYNRFVADHNKGEDGPQTYTWDEGVAP